MSVCKGSPPRLRAVAILSSTTAASEGTPFALAGACFTCRKNEDVSPRSQEVSVSNKINGGVQSPSGGRKQHENCCQEALCRNRAHLHDQENVVVFVYQVVAMVYVVPAARRKNREERQSKSHSSRRSHRSARKLTQSETHWLNSTGKAMSTVSPAPA